MGLLKGTFQSLKEIRIQLINTKRHKVIIMWARVCIILHNLIIRIEGDNFDEQWRECLVRTGLDMSTVPVVIQMRRSLKMHWNRHSDDLRRLDSASDSS
jgi:hypothetical protein